MNELRFALRQMWKHPAFTGVAVLALAVGVGINTTIFSFVDHLLLRPLVLPDQDRLMGVWATDTRHRGGMRDRTGVAPADFRDWQSQATVFEQVAAYDGWTPDLSGSGDAERLFGSRVTANFFAALAAAPARGNLFGPEAEVPGRDESVVLSHRLWQRRFGADPTVVGRTIRLDGRPHVVTAVMPAEFDYPTGAEFWVPLALTPEAWTVRTHGSLQTVARLKPGVSPRQAKTELHTIAARLKQAYPETLATRGVNPLTLHERTLIESGSGVALTLAGGATLFVLLLVCANLANFQLARGLSRTREMAIRLALGATRPQLVRQLLAESTLLALCGGVLGITLSVWGVAVMKAAMPASVSQFLTGWSQIGLDARALGFTLGLAALAGILAGLAPALAVSQPTVGESLKEGGQQATAGGRRNRLRNGLVVFEVCLAFVLLTGAGLLVKSFLQFSQVSSGMDVDGVAGFAVDLPQHRYEQPAQVASFRQTVVDQLRAVPGVEEVALASRSPVDNWWPRMIEFADSPASRPGEWRPVASQSVSAQYFRTLRIPQRSGRLFEARDDGAAPKVAVVSESVVRRFFPEGNPVGRRFRTDAMPEGDWITVVGVVGDLKPGLQSRSQEAIYCAVAQEASRSMTFLVRSAGDPAGVLPVIRERLRAIDPEQPLMALGALRDQVLDNMGGLRMMAGLLTVTGVLALGLASLGIYSVMAQNVTQRTQEIGIRMALGAARRDVLGMVLRSGMKLAGLGLAIGLPLAIGLGWLLSSQLGDEILIAAIEPLPLAAVLVLLSSAAFLACWWPSQRAARVEPMVALRCE